jgi:hypothetical protein
MEDGTACFEAEQPDSNVSPFRPAGRRTGQVPMRSGCHPFILKTRIRACLKIPGVRRRRQESRTFQESRQGSFCFALTGLVFLRGDLPRAALADSLALGYYILPSQGGGRNLPDTQDGLQPGTVLGSSSRAARTPPPSARAADAKTKPS